MANKVKVDPIVCLTTGKVYANCYQAIKSLGVEYKNCNTQLKNCLPIDSKYRFFECHWMRLSDVNKFDTLENARKHKESLSNKKVLAKKRTPMVMKTHLRNLLVLTKLSRNEVNNVVENFYKFVKKV